MRNINAGDLRQQVVWNSQTTSINSVGQQIPSYVSNGSFYALVEQLSSNEVVNADQRKGLRNYRVTMRNVGVIRPTDRLTWVDSQSVTRTLNVNGSTVDPFGILIEIEATEIIANQ